MKKSKRKNTTKSADSVCYSISYTKTKHEKRGEDTGERI